VQHIRCSKDNTETYEGPYLDHLKLSPNTELYVVPTLDWLLVQSSLVFSS